MTAYVLLRGAALKLCEERAAEAPDALYRVSCLTCSAQSDLVRDDARPVQVWALGHAQEHGLNHNQFRLTTHRYWRVDPAHAPVGATPWPPPAGSARVLRRVAAPVSAPHATRRRHGRARPGAGCRAWRLLVRAVRALAGAGRA
ncbi:DUF7848 domain-containing protein [Streptomyces sp. 4N509B]|uniref:DUF7848 domain-containing protein n=1 Tax=Streptomyces sp. 4N509B TaxID=3457413 RepID=UPI003FD2AF53